MKWLARAWFPVAAIVLVVLALPGLALFVLHVLGMETEVNNWLERNYRFSFHVTLPMWAAGILLWVPFLLILLASGIGQKPTKWAFLLVLISVVVNLWGVFLINKLNYFTI